MNGVAQKSVLAYKFLKVLSGPCEEVAERLPERQQTMQNRGTERVAVAERTYFAEMILPRGFFRGIRVG